jgi:ubiquinone/menaquinone biosynthesis C-methylase UbiE
MSSFKVFEKNAWEEKASRYESSWGVVTKQVIPKILELSKLNSKESILDIGCGPGHLCDAAQKLGAEVIGCDYSSEMVQIASKNYPNCTFRVEDAEELTFGDEQFNVVTLNYLLLHVADQGKVIEQAIRTLKYHGRLVYTLWQPPEESKGLAIIFQALKAHADLSVIPAADDIFQFAKLDSATVFLNHSGFSNIQATSFPTFWNVRTKDDFFNSVIAGTRMGGTIELQSAEIKSKIKEQIFVALEDFRTADGFLIPQPSLIVCAVRD